MNFEWIYVVYGVGLLIALFYVCSGFFVVDQWERLPMKRFGKYTETAGPGIHWYEPISTSAIDTISIRDQVDDLCDRLRQPASVQTHDNVPVKFKPLLTYRISDPEKFALNLEDGFDSLWSRAMVIVSEHVSNTELDSILHDRQALYSKLKAALQAAVLDWGVDVIAIELRDVSIADSSIQEAIAMKARAQKEAEAELTRAKMQTVIAEQLKQAAHMYDESAWKLKGFETLLELCRSASNNTVMIPTDLVQAIARIAK
jgi:regulator of protease activity HflC (stomatin/prohibitin superfamily)